MDSGERVKIPTLALVIYMLVFVFLFAVSVISQNRDAENEQIEEILTPNKQPGHVEMNEV